MVIVRTLHNNFKMLEVKQVVTCIMAWQCRSFFLRVAMNNITSRSRVRSQD